MALCSLRLRRAVTLYSSLIKYQRPFSAIPAVSAPPSLSSATLNSQNSRFVLAQPHHLHLPFQSRPFRSSTVSLSPPRTSYNNNKDEIPPDTVLFEGCDYNHWLITMEFPKDPKPTPEEMVETYVHTLAKVVGSVEEAKKRMYACSTTTYTGFQAVMSEETSEKFKGLPGVVFVLPDSYIDPINKEYGGDKYIDGKIIPRPPPVQYGRQGGRYGDRNREFNRNRPRGPSQHPPGNTAYDNQGSMHGDTRNYGAEQNSSPQQNYGRTGPGERREPMPMNNAPGGPGVRREPMPMNNAPGAPGERRGPMPMNNAPGGPGERREPMPMNNAPGGRDTYQGDRRDTMPPYQANYNQGARGNYYPQGQRDFPPGDRRDYAPPEQRDIRADNRYYAPPQGGSYGQGAGGSYGQGVGGTHGQVAGGTYGQGAGGDHGQDMGSGYGQSYPGHGGNQRFSQVEQGTNMQGEQRNYAATGHTGTDQGRY